MSGNSRPAQAEETVSAKFWERAQMEQAYLANHKFSIAGNSSDNAHLQNPDGTGVTAVFTRVTVSTQFQASIDVHDSFSSAPSGGTSRTIENQVMDTTGAADEGELNFNTGTSFTADGTHAQSVVGGGTGELAVGATGGLPVFSMEENREIVIEVTNETSNEDDATITMAYFELDELLSQ